MPEYRHSLGTSSYVFKDLRTLLAKASPREELAPPAPRETPTAPTLRFSPQNMALVREGMVQVVAAGTASTLKVDSKGRPLPPELMFAGKTGTAQVRAYSQEEHARGITKNSALDWKLRDHALFIAFAPLENPSIVVAVMVENGGHGGSTAAPIARKVFDYWVTGHTPPGAAPMPEDRPGQANGDREDAVEEPETATAGVKTHAL